ncbi:UvrD-helicase domain-containing protein [Lysobacter koreensis]|uniref:RecBCD enzyme subunit RecB n=1 Tax=Lysobacter koreensis TaxID=266122 RepID=A0ABW2YPZ0_9GAMM
MNLPATGAVARDPYLDLELRGLRLIEASAGTGKTYTLATLVTRLVIERGLRVSQVLAVTFTEAATQELRERLRRRLQLAARIATDLPAYRDDDNAEVALTRTLIEAQLQREDAVALRARLQRAAHEIDLAAVFTIHGFCARALSEHALETGQAFVAPTMVGGDRELRAAVATDLWRALGADPLDAQLLQRHWPGGPDALAADLGALLRATRVLPALPSPSPDPLPGLTQAFAALRAAQGAHGDDARARLDAAIDAKVIDGRKARAASYAQAWASLAQGVAGGTLVRDAAHLDKLTPARLRECAKAGREDDVPASPLFDALAAWFAADLAREQWLAAQGVALVHRVRAQAGARLAQLKRLRREQTYDDLIDGVAAALDGPHGAALARRLRAQYAVALVDEFQDTDPRQWGIFARVFGGAADRDDGALVEVDEATVADHDAPALFLIGDPKQAIYRFRGGDVHTYLDAAASAQDAPPLAHNFRSRPALLRAVDALYARAGAGAFVDERIAFRPVTAGGRVADADFQRAGRPAPALTVRALPPPADGRKSAQWSAPESRELATRACVAEIHGVLHAARDGDATIVGRALQPADIAVLVRSHAEAAQVQAALVAAGIPAVAAGRQSLYASEQALELLALFEALLQPGDDGRLRAALATVLLGLDAHAIARGDSDAAWQRDWQLRALAWRERWQRHGPLALVTDLCAQHAPRLLALGDGERRLTNTLQLGEALQEADRRALGLHGLVDWLRTRIAQADDFDETQQLRLESDARRVQVMTLHKSKGLEFGLVLLPFAGIGKERKPGRWCEVPAALLASADTNASADGRVLQLPGDDAQWALATRAWQREERAEDARLLYVGLTRARHALWLAGGPLYRHDDTPLAAMLGDLASLPEDHGIVVDASGLPPPRLAPLPPPDAGALPAARRARRTLARDWWVYSFTQLTHEAAGQGSAAAADEIPLARAEAGERGAADETRAVDALPRAADAVNEPAFDRRYSGSRFGNVLHAALEHVDFAAWRGVCDGSAPPAQDAPLRAALHGEGYAQADLDDGLPLLAALVGQTLNVALPEGVRLCELPADARRAEMEFHFALQPTHVDELLAVLHAHGVLRERHAFGARRRLEGLMTGKIDLVYAHEGRYYVLDYKSNRLPAYDATAVAQAMADSEYTLQALIYTLALHRWLRFRLGDGYDYARDFGGVRYLFCRGLDAHDPASPGVHAQQPAAALVDALDALFAAPGHDPSEARA